MENKKQVYTQGDGEKWTDYEDLMNDLKEHYNIGEIVQVWEADKKEWKHSDFINLESILQDIQFAAMDECGEVAEEYLNGLSDKKKDELKDHIADWFVQNGKINFYGVENEHRIVVVVE